MSAHRQCSPYTDEDNAEVTCEANEPSTCPAVQAARRWALAKEGSWSKLELRREHGDERHYLDGRAIHCGTGLELQAIEHRSDDYGEYVAVLQRGRRVRYETAWRGQTPETLDRRVVLHVGVDGHEFTSRMEGWMRFRWPRDER